MKSKKSCKSQKLKYSSLNAGFTILELMVTVAVLVILITTSVPMMQNLIHQSRMDGEAERLFTLLKLARNTAVTTGRPAYVCPTNNADNFVCDNQGANWASDVLIYTQPPGALPVVPNNGFENQKIESLIASQDVRAQQLRSVVEASNSIVMSTANRDDAVIRFNADGTLENVAPYRIGICEVDDETARNGNIIEIGAGGQVRRSPIDADDANRNCIPTTII